MLALFERLGLDTVEEIGVRARLVMGWMYIFKWCLGCRQDMLPCAATLGYYAKMTRWILRGQEHIDAKCQRIDAAAAAATAA